MDNDEKPAEQSDEKPRRRRAKAEGEICEKHWPNGWPEGADTASCVHGAYTR